MSSELTEERVLLCEVRSSAMLVMHVLPITIQFDLSFCAVACLSKSSVIYRPILIIILYLN